MSEVILCKCWELILASVSEIERKNYYGWIQDGGIQVGRIQEGCYYQVESDWMSEVFLCKWWELILASVSEIERKNYYGWIQDGGILNGRIQDGCYYQVKWEWMSLSQIELVWVRVTVEWECFWVNLREDNKVSESKMAEFKMAVIINWVRMNKWSFFVQNGWIEDGRIQDGCHHQVKWEWMSLSQIELVWVRVTVEWECFWVNLREENKVSESNIAEFKMPAIIKLSQNEWVKFFLCK